MGGRGGEVGVEGGREGGRRGREGGWGGSNGVAMIFFGGGPIFRDLRRPTAVPLGGGGSSRNFPGSP